jgi:hypothetical protein
MVNDPSRIAGDAQLLSETNVVLQRYCVWLVATRGVSALCVRNNVNSVHSAASPRVRRLHAGLRRRVANRAGITSGRWG